MKFKLIEKDKKGFARYCPTFARAYDCISEGIRRKRFERLVKRLSDKNVNVWTDAAEALWTTASKGADMKVAIPALVKALGDEDWDTRLNAAGALGNVAGNGTDITAAIPALVKLLSGERELVRATAAWVLLTAALEGTDITAAIPALAKALSDGSVRVREYAAKALEKAANQRDQKTRTLVVNEIIGFVRSDWFQGEMEKNSVAYEAIANNIANLLDMIRDAKKKAA